jgi:hypothetical protein
MATSSGDSEPEDTRSIDTGHRDYAFITALSRAHVQKLPCDEANMAFIMSPVQEKARAPGDDKPKRLSSIRRKPVPQLYDKENSWSMREFQSLFVCQSGILSLRRSYTNDSFSFSVGLDD